MSENNTYAGYGGAAIGVVLAVLALGQGCDLDARIADGSPFVPPSGRTLLLVGQDLSSIAGYVSGVSVEPGGVTTYTDLSETRHPELLWGLEDTVDYGAGQISARAVAASYPESVLAIGLYLVDHTGTNLTHIARGTHDAAIDRLGSFISEVRRPVFLRIGYEFDGPWNHYEPDAYVAAYRHIVDRLRDGDVQNVATVWQSATSIYGTYQDRPVDAWYPGDVYVDWIGMSYFIQDEEIFSRLLSFARERQKPVMVAEAAPQGYDLEELTYSPPTDGATFTYRTPETIWREWYEPFFAFTRENADVIRAISYINCDWNAQLMWMPGAGNGYWGDSRVEANGEIRGRWLEEIREPMWLHGSPRLFEVLGYEGAAGGSTSSNG